MEYTDFIQLGTGASPDELVCKFRATPAPGVELTWCAGGVAAESSIGTWDPGLKTMREADRDLGARVITMDEARGTFEVAYPTDLFEAGNLSQILSSITGNVYGLKEVSKLRLLDCTLPEAMVRSFPGPQVGLPGARDITGVTDRPLVGTIVKPKLGLDAESWADAAYRAWRGGLDFVKDDENLTHMTFNGFYERTERVIALKKKAEEETGEKKLYFANITAPTSEMKRRADHVIALGNEYVMIDILTAGWSAVQEMREHLEGRGVGVHAHRAQHGAYTRLDDHGIDFLPMAKWSRLAGVDNLHAGTIGAGKMHVEGGRSHNLEIYEFLRSDWHGLTPVVPVASGGLHPGVVPRLVEQAGVDFAAAFGGGVHGHPDGSEAGARAVRQAMEAALDGASLEDAAATNKDLARALEKWGRRVVGGEEAGAEEAPAQGR